AADPPPLPEQRTVDVQPGGRQVLSEPAVTQFAAQLPLPPVVILPGVGVHGLARRTVVGLVGPLVTGQPVDLDRHPVRHRPLVDGRALQLACPVGVKSLTDIYRNNTHGGTLSESPSTE